MQWENDRSMVYVHDVRTGARRSLDQIVPGVTRAQEAALSGDGHRLGVVLTDDERAERSVAVLEAGSHDVDLLADGRLVVGRKVYRF